MISASGRTGIVEQYRRRRMFHMEYPCGAAVTGVPRGTLISEVWTTEVWMGRGFQAAASLTSREKSAREASPILITTLRVPLNSQDEVRLRIVPILPAFHSFHTLRLRAARGQPGQGHLGIPMA